MKRWPKLAILLLLSPVAGHAVCNSVAASPLTFGTYTSSSAVYVTATVTTNCSSGYAYVLGLGAGNSNNTGARTMTTGALTLGYQMYKDASRTVNWGANNGVDTINATGTGSNQTFTIYGLLPAGQYATPGTYTDVPTAYIQNSGYFVNMSVTATAASSCTISTTNMVFGTYTGAQKDSTATISITCSNTTPYNIGIQTGLHGVGNFDWELLGPSGSKLAYKVYTDSGRTIYWGGSVPTDTVNGTGSGVAQPYTAYGRIAAGQYVTPGAYTDTVTFTLYY